MSGLVKDFVSWYTGGMKFNMTIEAASLSELNDVLKLAARDILDGFGREDDNGDVKDGMGRVVGSWRVS